jgi:hypothetical protein
LYGCKGGRCDEDSSNDKDESVKEDEDEDDENATTHQLRAKTKSQNTMRWVTTMTI